MSERIKRVSAAAAIIDDENVDRNSGASSIEQ
jgi:hypothetical protein